MTMMTKRSAFAAIVLLAVCAAAIGLFVSKERHREPAAGPKVIGSEMIEFGTRIPVTSLEQLLSWSDAAILGEVVSEAETVAHDIKSGTPLDRKVQDQFNKTPSYYTANVKVRIKEVLHGKLDEQEITYAQLGKAGDDMYQTKVKQGEQVVLLLKRDSTDGTYASVAFEEGVFLVDESGRVVSQSNNQAVAKYDHADFKTLAKDIRGIKPQ